MQKLEINGKKQRVESGSGNCRSKRRSRVTRRDKQNWGTFRVLASLRA